MGSKTPSSTWRGQCCASQQKDLVLVSCFGFWRFWVVPAEHEQEVCEVIAGDMLAQGWWVCTAALRGVSCSITFIESRAEQNIIIQYIYIWFSIVFVDLPFSSRVSYRGLKSSVSSYTRRRTCSRAYCFGYVVVCLLLPSSFMGIHFFCMCVCVHPQLFLGKCQDSMQSCAPYVYRRYLFHMIQLQLYNITRKRLQKMIKHDKTI